MEIVTNNVMFSLNQNKTNLSITADVFKTIKEIKNTLSLRDLFDHE